MPSAEKKSNGMDEEAMGTKPRDVDGIDSANVEISQIESCKEIERL
jgi:hypothetical protein